MANITVNSESKQIPGRDIHDVQWQPCNTSRNIQQITSTQTDNPYLRDLYSYSEYNQQLIIQFGIRFLECVLDKEFNKPASVSQQIIPSQIQHQSASQIQILNNQDTRINTSQYKYDNSYNPIHDTIQTNQSYAMLFDNTRVPSQIIQVKSPMGLQTYDQVKNPTSSQMIGQLGEDWVERALVSQYPQAVITNTSKVAGSGDLVVKLQNRTILVEVKNYNTSVPQKEVDKFHNDVNTSQCDCAVFISFKQRIANKPRIVFEMSQSNKQLIFLSQQENPDTLLVIIDLLVKSVDVNKQSIDQLKQKHKISKQSITDSITIIKKQHNATKTQLKALKEHLDSLIYIDQQLDLDTSKLLDQHL